jgi:hypothetical protein
MVDTRALIASSIASAAVSATTFFGKYIIAVDTTPEGVLAQAGVFAAALFVGYFLLRRSDTREAAKDTELRAERDLAKAERDALTKLLEEERVKSTAEILRLNKLLAQCRGIGHRHLEDEDL